MDISYTSLYNDRMTQTRYYVPRSVTVEAVQYEWSSRSAVAPFFAAMRLVSFITGTPLVGISEEFVEKYATDITDARVRVRPDENRSFMLVNRGDWLVRRGGAVEVLTDTRFVANYIETVAP